MLDSDECVENPCSSVVFTLLRINLSLTLGLIRLQVVPRPGLFFREYELTTHIYVIHLCYIKAHDRQIRPNENYKNHVPMKWGQFQLYTVQTQAGIIIIHTQLGPWLNPMFTRVD